ncbi:MAG: cytochrome c-type biogenesis protein [Pseudomonadota bacterium]
MIRVLVLLLVMLANPAWAVLPDEMLTDPALEARARAISRTIRCPVCQGESIDDSAAPISRDLRLIIRERMVAGDTDAEVTEFLVARYGEFVLFRPTATGVNLILWAAGPLMLLTGIGVAFATLRRRGEEAEQDLTEAESIELARILDHRPD